MTFTIRLACKNDLSFLREIETSAATIFPDGYLPKEILCDSVPMDILEDALREQMLFIAENSKKTPVGFALLMMIEGNALLAEIDVHPGYGKRGIGTALINSSLERLKEIGKKEVYLTTCTAVPWNAPFYAKIGFQIIDWKNYPPFIQKISVKERECGLKDRVAMKMDI